MSARARLALLCAALATGGCTFEEGSGFATLRAASLEAAFEPGARELDGRVLTDLGYRVRVDELTLRFTALELVSSTSATPRAAFDPSDPPPGYTFCHGAHCHAEDGRLVDIADVQAEASGADSAETTVATLTVERSIDLLASSPVALRDVAPSAELPRAQIRQVVLTASALAISGTLGASEAEERPFAVELSAPIRFEGTLSLDISRDGPEVLELDVFAGVDGTLFDGVEWASVASPGAPVLVDDIDAPEGAALLSSLTRNELRSELR